jgi:hypothetical protein
VTDFEAVHARLREILLKRRGIPGFRDVAEAAAVGRS